MSFNQWTARIDEKARAISAAADASDWMMVNVLVAEFSEVLQMPQTEMNPGARDVFERAQNLITQILATAADARTLARTELQQITKGRKAIAAYR